jgi:hypothetical protein
MTVEPSCDRLEWLPWISYDEAEKTIPPVEGIYKARRLDSVIVYVGKAGKRERYNGLQGRFRMYAGGKMTGLAQNALTQALKNSEWIREIADETARGVFTPASGLVRRAIKHANLEISWALCPGISSTELTSLERGVRAAVAHQEGLWSWR